MEKTMRELLMELPDGYRERALENTEKVRMNSLYRSADGGLCSAFDWAESPEGGAFWSKVCNYLADGRDITDLPPLPDTAAGFVAVDAGSDLAGEPTNSFAVRAAGSKSLLDEIALSLITAKVTHIHKDQEIGDDKIRQCYETAKRVLEIRKEFV